MYLALINAITKEFKLCNIFHLPGDGWILFCPEGFFFKNVFSSPWRVRMIINVYSCYSNEKCWQVSGQRAGESQISRADSRAPVSRPAGVA